MRKIALKLLDPRLKDPQYAPQYATPGAAGIDLRACIDRAMKIHPGETLLVPSGIALHIADPSLAAVILPRSGLGHKHGIVLTWNRSHETFTLNPLDRLAQLVVLPVVQVGFDVIDEFPESPRGAGGFGSTGKD